MREWLDAMVVWSVVETDTSNHQYWLPQHRANTLSTKGAPALFQVMQLDGDEGNVMFPMFDFCADMVARVKEDVQACFWKDGPLGWFGGSIGTCNYGG